MSALFKQLVINHTKKLITVSKNKNVMICTISFYTGIGSSNTTREKIVLMKLFVKKKINLNIFWEILISSDGIIACLFFLKMARATSEKFLIQYSILFLYHKFLLLLNLNDMFLLLLTITHVRVIMQVIYTQTRYIIFVGHKKDSPISK